MSIASSHKLPKDWAEGVRERAMPILFARIEKAMTDPRSLNLVSLYSETAYAFSTALGESVEDASIALFARAEALDCLISCAVNEGTRNLRLAGKLVEFHRADVADIVCPGKWFQAFCFNTICRRQAAIQRLLQVPEDRLNNSAIQEPESRRELFRAIVLAMAGADELVVEQQLLRAQQATDPDREDVFDPEFVLSFDAYWIHLISMLVRKDEEGFAKWLTAALEKHKAYWKKSKKRREEPEGFLATNLIGIAAWAWDKGFRFEIESDYLPMRFVTGEFLKDVPYAQTSQ
jgi:hypothetical protein